VRGAILRLIVLRPSNAQLAPSRIVF
jgi:hypothetical protein